MYALGFEILSWLHFDPEKSSAFDVVQVIAVLGCVIYYALGNLLPRIRNIGWNPLTLPIMLIPI